MVPLSWVFGEFLTSGVLHGLVRFLIRLPYMLLTWQHATHRYSLHDEHAQQVPGGLEEASCEREKEHESSQDQVQWPAVCLGCLLGGQLHEELC